MAVSFLKSLRIPKIKHFQTIWPHFYEGLSHLQHNSCQISVPLPFRVSQRCPTLASIHFCALSSCTFHFLSPFFLLSTSCLICTWCISTLGSSVVPTPLLYVSQLSYTCHGYICPTLFSNMPMCIAGSLVMMGVTWQTMYLRRVCVRIVMHCVSSV